MTNNTYTATLEDGDSSESIELEFIDGEPQKSVVRVADAGGVPVEAVWELDTSAPQYTYRPVLIDDAAEGTDESEPA